MRKILRLDLEAFGPFTGTTLDFSDEGASFHVVYGPNEAGKSTALRALHGVLFGIPETSQDSHLHPANALRVGALLLDADGARLEVVRRRGRTNTLRGSDGEPLDPGALAPLLRGIREEEFERYFGLDHERLRAGAAALVESEGQVGRSLFDAGLGGRSIAGLLAALEDERRSIWSPRASKPILNAAIAQLKKAEARKKSEGLSAQDWAIAEKEREALEVTIATLAEEQKRLRVEQRRLERVCRVVPLAAEHVELAARRGALGDGPLIAPESIARRREISARHDANGRHVARAAAQREEIARQRANVTVDANALALPDEAVDGLAERLAAYRRGAAERPARAAELGLVEERLARNLRALGRTSLDDAERARPQPAAMARLRALAARRSGLEQAVRAAREALARADARIETTAARLAKLGVSRDAGELERAAEAAKREGDLRARLEDANRALEARRRELEAAVRALSPWSGSNADLVAIVRPLDETVERLVADDEAQRRDRARLEEELAELGRARAKLARDLDLLLSKGAPPSDDDLRAARARRDALFAELRATGDAAGVAGAALGEAMREADAIADRLREEAARVAEKKAIEIEARDLERRGADAAVRLAIVDARDAEVRDELGEACGAVGVALRAPGELRGFLRRFDEARACVGRVAEAEEIVRGIERAEARHAARLRELLGATDAEDLCSLLDRADRAIREVREGEAERRTLVDAAARSREERAELAASLATEQQEISRFLVDWSEAVAGLGLAPSATTQEVDAILELLGELSSDGARASELRRELDAMQRDADALARLAAELVERHALDLAGAEVERQVAEVVRRHREARELSAHAKGLDAELARLDSERAAAAAELEADGRELAAFLSAAGAQDVAALASLEERSDAARSLDERLAAIESTLAREGDGAHVETLLRELEGVSLDRAREDLASVEMRLEQLSGEEKLTEKRLGAVLARLEQAAERSADDAAAEVESQLAEVSAQSFRYARAALAAAILRREIERYRRSHEGPILAGARALLPRLTLGRYRDLRVLGAGEAGSLRCVRADGAEVAVDALSDGTRDQLFLALRLAAIAVHAREQPPLPLVLDDVFIHFDDERARAGLEVLGELSATTQILFFTHHARLVELARAAIPTTRLRVHSLERAASVSTAEAETSMVGEAARVPALEGEVGDER